MTGSRLSGLLLPLGGELKNVGRFTQEAALRKNLVRCALLLTYRDDPPQGTLAYVSADLEQN